MALSVTNHAQISASSNGQGCVRCSDGTVIASNAGASYRGTPTGGTNPTAFTLMGEVSFAAENSICARVSGGGAAYLSSSNFGMDTILVQRWVNTSGTSSSITNVHTYDLLPTPDMASMCIDSNGRYHIVFYDSVASMGTEYPTLYYTNDVATAGTFKTPVEIEGVSNQITLDPNQLSIVIDGNDIPTVMFRRLGNPWGATGNANNATSFTLDQLSAGVDTSRCEHMAADNNGNIYLPVIITSTNDLRIWKRTSAGTTFSDVLQHSGKEYNFIIGCHIHGTKLYVFFSDDTNNTSGMSITVIDISTSTPSYIETIEDTTVNVNSSGAYFRPGPLYGNYGSDDTDHGIADTKPEMDLVVLVTQARFVTVSVLAGDITVSITGQATVSGVLTGKGALVGRTDSFAVENTLIQATATLQNGSTIRIGQELLGFYGQLFSVQFNIFKNGSPDHDLTAVLYNDSAGSPGTAIQTSAVVQASTLGTTGAWVTFTFSNPSLVNQNAYIILEASNFTVSDGSNNVSVNNSVNQVPGRRFTYISSWVGGTAFDMTYILGIQTTVGVLTQKSNNPIVGNIDAAATVQGILTGAGALVSVVNITPTVLGVLTANGALVGTINITPTVQGILTAIGLLAGSSDGSATVQGVLTAIGNMLASSNGLATVQGTLTAKGSLAGIINASATVDGNLTPASTIGPLVGNIDAFATVQGILTANGGLVGTIDITPTVQGLLTANGSLVVIVNGVATVDGTLTALGSLIAQATGLATTEGILTAIGNLVSQSNGVATVQGVMSAIGSLLAQSNGLATVDGTLTAKGALAGVINAGATVSGSLDTNQLLGTINALATVQGVLSGIGNLVGSTTLKYEIQNVVALWNFNGNSTEEIDNISATDTLMNYVPGKFGLSASFAQDITSKITVPDNDKFSFVSKDFSISIWVKLNTVQNSLFIIKNTSTGVDREYAIWYDHGATSTLVWRVFDQSNNAYKSIHYVNWNPTADTWYHIGGSYTSSTKSLLLTVNGVQQGIISNSGTFIDLENLPGVITFGNFPDTTTFSLDGEIDNPVIIGEAYSVSQFNNIYTSNLPVAPQSVYGSLSAIGALLGTINGQSTVSGLLSSNGSMAGIVNGLATVQGTLTAKGTLEGAINIFGGLRGLLSAFKLDSNNTDSITGLTGTDISVSYVAGKIGNCARFAGSNSYINYGYVEALDLDAELSISAWINPDTYSPGPGGAVICTWVSPGFTTYPFHWVIQTNGLIRLNANNIPIDGVTQIPTGVWSHVAVTRSASGLVKHYLNGVLDNSGNQTVPAGPVTGENIFTISRKDTQWFDGNIDDLAIGGTELSADEILMIYNMGNNGISVADLSGAYGTLKGIGALVGTINGQATVQGDLIGTAPNLLAGQIDGFATVIGTLTAKGALVGVINGQSTIQGVLGYSSSKISGVADGQATVEGTLTGKGELAGSSDGQADVSGYAYQKWQLDGEINASALVQGELTGKSNPLLGVARGKTIISATLSGKGALVGVVNGSSSVIGDFYYKKLKGDVNGQATVIGILTYRAAIAGVSDGVATVSGTLNDANEKMYGDTTGQSDVQGILTALGKLAGIINGKTTLSGTLTETARPEDEEFGEFCKFAVTYNGSKQYTVTYNSNPRYSVTHNENEKYVVTFNCQKQPKC